jgi:hypothetical protein
MKELWENKKLDLRFDLGDRKHDAESINALEAGKSEARGGWKRDFVVATSRIYSTRQSMKRTCH